MLHIFASSQSFSGLFYLANNLQEAQEAFADSSSDESLIFEMLDFKKVIKNDANAVWFLEDIAHEQDEEESMWTGKEPTLKYHKYRDAPVIYTTAVGQMTISKAKEWKHQ